MNLLPALCAFFVAAASARPASPPSDLSLDQADQFVQNFRPARAKSEAVRVDHAMFEKIVKKLMALPETADASVDGIETGGQGRLAYAREFEARLVDEVDQQADGPIDGVIHHRYSRLLARRTTATGKPDGKVSYDLLQFELSMDGRLLSVSHAMATLPARSDGTLLPFDREIPDLLPLKPSDNVAEWETLGRKLLTVSRSQPL